MAAGGGITGGAKMATEIGLPGQSTKKEPRLKRTSKKIAEEDL
jgi:hypothetical protein